MAHKSAPSHHSNRCPAGMERPSVVDPVLQDWIRIGSLAWSGHCAQGRGLVMVTVNEDSAAYRYWPGTPCDCHARWVDEYDPESEAIVLVCRGETESIYRVKASPTPPEAWALDVPEDAGRTAH